MNGTASLERRRRGRPRELVLVGGGHSHVQVLKALAMEPLEGPSTRLTVVVDRPIAVYSGMVPGFVAGRYAAHELEIDVVPLARRAGARVILARATRIDAAARRIHLEGRPSIAYDVASVDIGSVVAGLDVPGVREHAIPTRPISRFVERVDEVVARARRASGRFHVVVVGGGAGGVEIAFTMRERLRDLETGRPGLSVETTLVFDSPHLLDGAPSSLVRRVESNARDAGITLRPRSRVVAADASSVHLHSSDDHSSDDQARETEIPCDALLWVTGAAPQGVLRASGLPVDERGFVLVDSTLRVVGYDDLFAVGDCATLSEHRWVPKAGVYAVRQGPVLTENLRRWARRSPPERWRDYEPQRDFLTLLNLGDGRAVGAKWGVSFEGAWVMALKDRIDRRFMTKFEVLEPSGALRASEFPEMPPMDVLCGGCAAKVGQDVLERSLARLDTIAGDQTPPGVHAPANGRPSAGHTSAGPTSAGHTSAGHTSAGSIVLGLDAADDASAVRAPSGDLLVSSVDAFPAFTDDPYLVGRVAAVNAASDLLATGVAPHHALALVTLPEDLDDEGAEETLTQVLAGLRDGLGTTGAELIGGHTTTGAGLFVGLSISGFEANDADLLTLDALRPDDRIVLTKPLGTGVVLHADMRGGARGPWLEAALRSMQRSNRHALEVARAVGARAATDVTGFGLAGHLGGMARRSGASIRVELDALPALPGAIELLARGERSTFHAQNARARRGLEIAPGLVDDPALELLFDPQTSGGLLFGVAPERAGGALSGLQARGDAQAAVIGRVVPVRPSGAPLEVVR